MHGFPSTVNWAFSCFTREIRDSTVLPLEQTEQTATAMVTSLTHGVSPSSCHGHVMAMSWPCFVKVTALSDTPSPPKVKCPATMPGLDGKNLEALGIAAWNAWNAWNTWNTWNTWNAVVSGNDNHKFQTSGLKPRYQRLSRIKMIQSFNYIPQQRSMVPISTAGMNPLFNIRIIMFSFIAPSK